MKIAFTICSNNYLAQARILCDSLLGHNPEYKMIIGLCDKKIPEIDYDVFGDVEIIPVEDISIYEFNQIVEKYDIVELNTSIKPSFFKFFINKYKELESIIYFDPDIQVFNSLSILHDYMKKDDILLTPHIFKPIPVDDYKPTENLFLNYGIYNLGFIALNPKSDIVAQFLNWWEERTLKIGYSRVSDGLFVDQLWINLVPLFFDKVKILPEYGFNVAPWNLHERSVSFNKESEYCMMDGTDFYFFHFSNYNYLNPFLLSKYYDRYSIADASPDILNLYAQYHQKLVQNKVDFFSIIPCSLLNKNIVSESVAIKQEQTLKISDFIPPIVVTFYKKLSKKFSDFY